MDRRRRARRVPSPEEPLSRVRLRTGHELAVINVSDGGVLVEGARLLPGTHLDVHVVTSDGRVLVRSRVVRAYISELDAASVRYRGALAFDRPVDTSAIGSAIPSSRPALPDAPGIEYPAPADPYGLGLEPRLTA